MKVLALLTDAYGGYGGIAKFNRDLLNSLALIPEIEEITAIPFFKPFTLEQTPPKINFLTQGLNNRMRYFWTAWKALRNNKYEILICGHINLLPLAWLLGRQFQKKVLLMHGLEAWQAPQGFLKMRALRTFEHFVAVSEVTQKRFISWSHTQNHHWFILPNCIDLNEYQPAPINIDLATKHQTVHKKVLLTMARLVPGRNKGVDPIIELLPELAKETPNIRYLIVGAGPDQLRLKQKCQALGVRHLVEFVGYVRENSKPDIYRLADAFIMAGDQEGFGIVYLEAMACGVPVIASTLDGSREAVMEGRLGQMVDPQNKSEIKAAILKAFQMPKGQRPEGLEYFSFDQFKARVQMLVNTLKTH
jgi:glycosyltransferase involved in cell wall biosynthesis